MKRLRRALTYSNVMVTALAFVVLGGSAYAAVHLGGNTVGNKQLKKNSVSTGKIRNGAVTGAKVRDGSVTPADLSQPYPTEARASNVIGISISGDGKCTPARPLPPGVTSTDSGVEGQCGIKFPSSVTNCSATAGVHMSVNGKTPVPPGVRTAEAISVWQLPEWILVYTYSDSKPADVPFDLTLVC